MPTLSLYISSIINGTIPTLSVLKYWPLAASALPLLSSFCEWVRTASISTLVTSPSAIVSGDILYCIIIDGYSELRSKLTTLS